MTREQYFEMCEALGSEPLEEEIPVEFEDLNPDLQAAFSIYQKLRDEWDTMNGVYLGKSFAGISDIFDILDIDADERRTTFDLINMIDKHRSAAYAANKPKKASS